MVEICLSLTDTNASIAWYCTNYFSIFICSNPHDATVRKLAYSSRVQPSAWKLDARRRTGKKAIHQRNEFGWVLGLGYATTANCLFFCESNSLSTNIPFKFRSEINWFLIKGNPIAMAKYWQRQQQQYRLGLDNSIYGVIRLSFSLFEMDLCGQVVKTRFIAMARHGKMNGFWNGIGRQKICCDKL